MRIQQFPGQSYDDLDSINGSNNFLIETKLNKNSRTSLISQQSSDGQICPVISEEKFIIQEDNFNNGLNLNPWAVKQTDTITNNCEVT